MTRTFPSRFKGTHSRARPESQVDLPFLLAPVSIEEFFDDFWEDRVLHVARNDSRYLGALQDHLSLEELLWQTCHRWGDVSIAGSSTTDSLDYSANLPDIPTIRRAFSEGRTVVINHLERKYLNVAWLCRNIERGWLFNTHVNLYATPSGKQGLSYHYDDDDVFIVQLDGSKRWKIFRERAGLPLSGEAYQQPECVSAGFAEYLLMPGDVLYIPRGFVHEAVALRSISVHLTITVTVVRALTLLQEVLSNAAEGGSGLRRAVPIGLLTGTDRELEQWSAEFAEGRVPDSVEAWRRARAGILEQLLASKARLPEINGRGVQASVDPESINEHSVVAVAADQLCLITVVDEAALFHFIGGTLELPLSAEPALRSLCRLEFCAVRDLPGQLTIPEKVGIVRALVAVGAVVPEFRAEDSTDGSIHSDPALRRDEREKECL